ncbi:hypothetical protein K9N68_05825 [Kovacikia minuta CCNUW1]|uniref:hypothetical protein n=1 Tax=Kovacikia minuta TaxID=2931930 RepID=UPI001CCCA14F|nr:hypothetical protein [Kovacikia minuta]UBF27463.1 hypothetical protein K9N68_05825 [Kovacikia minuta CCNUW1]
MAKHLVLSIDPAAKFDWQRCDLRDPLTHDSPNLSELVAEAVGNNPGNYLVSVNLEVKVLAQHEQPVEAAKEHPHVEVAAA